MRATMLPAKTGWPREEGGLIQWLSAQSAPLPAAPKWRTRWERRDREGYRERRAAEGAKARLRCRGHRRGGGRPPDALFQQDPEIPHRAGGRLWHRRRCARRSVRAAQVSGSPQTACPIYVRSTSSPVSFSHRSETPVSTLDRESSARISPRLVCFSSGCRWGRASPWDPRPS